MARGEAECRARVLAHAWTWISAGGRPLKQRQNHAIAYALGLGRWTVVHSAPGAVGIMAPRPARFVPAYTCFRRPWRIQRRLHSTVFAVPQGERPPPERPKRRIISHNARNTAFVVYRAGRNDTVCCGC